LKIAKELVVKMKARLVKLLRRLEYPCNDVNDGNVTQIYDVIFGGKRFEIDNTVINYYMGVSCVIELKMLCILELQHSKIITEDEDRRTVRIKEILERHGYIGFNVSYYARGLINDCLDPHWNSIQYSVKIEMKKYFEKAIDHVFALFELHQYYCVRMSLADIRSVAYNGHGRAASWMKIISEDKGYWIHKAVNHGNMESIIELYLLDKKRNIYYLIQSANLGQIGSIVHLGYHYVDVNDHWNAFRCFVKGFIESNNEIVARINNYSVNFFGFQIPIEVFDHVGVGSLRGLCLVCLFDLDFTL